MDEERDRLEADVARHRRELDVAIEELRSGADRLVGLLDVRRQLRRVPSPWLLAAGGALVLWWLRRR